MASYKADGSAEVDPVFPWKLRFAPTGLLSTPASLEEGYTDFRDDLARIPTGSTLYVVYATDKPEELGGTE